MAETTKAVKEGSGEAHQYSDHLQAREVNCHRASQREEPREGASPQIERHLDDTFNPERPSLHQCRLDPTARGSTQASRRISRVRVAGPENENHENQEGTKDISERRDKR